MVFQSGVKNITSKGGNMIGVCHGTDMRFFDASDHFGMKTGYICRVCGSYEYTIHGQRDYKEACVMFGIDIEEEKED